VAQECHLHLFHLRGIVSPDKVNEGVVRVAEGMEPMAAFG
jgi:hypothetical protein